MRSIRTRLLLNASIASVALFMIGGGIFYFIFSSVSEDAVGGALQRELSLTFKRIDEFQAERAKELEVFAESDSVATMLLDGNCARPDDVQRIVIPFQRNAWNSIGIFDATGATCAYSGESFELSDVEKDELKRTLNGSNEFSDALLDTKTGAAYQTVMVPVIGSDMNVSGVVFGRLGATALSRPLGDIGTPVQLLNASGVVIESIRSGSGVNRDVAFPDPVTVSGFASTLSLDDHGVMRVGAKSYVVAVASEPGVPGYQGKGWRLVSVDGNNMLFGDRFTLLGAILFGLIAVLGGLVFFARIPFRLIREMKRMVRYVQQRSSGAVAFIPKDIDGETRELYGAIEKLATRYNILAQSRDDGAIKLAQEVSECKDDRDRYAVMIGAMREGACALDNHGEITLCNSAAAKILERNRDEVIGKHYHDVFRVYSDEDMQREFDPFEKALRSGGIFAEEGPYYLLQAGGGALPVRIQSTVIRRGVDRASAGIFILIRDVAKEVAVEQSKNEFISVTSHQMRTPLATMRWHIERLLKPSAPPSPEKLKDYLSRIERNNKRMIRLTDALLDVSRIDLGTAKEKIEVVDVPAVVREVLDEIDEGTLSQRKILENYKGIEGQVVRCDPYLVRVVFENFIENAIAYTRPGGRVEIVAAIDGDSLRIDVEDDGIGIAADMKDKIFSKFVRGKDATSLSPEGTGLGLYITKSLIERAGGRIWFTSNRNEGSTFSVRFPLAEVK